MMNTNTSPADALSIDTDVVTDLLIRFMRSEVWKVEFDRVVVGLSGGIDSAVSAALAVRALGPENVIPMIMPHTTSSRSSEADAREVASALGMEPVVIGIGPQIDCYFAQQPDADRTRRGNKMARERMAVLYDQSVARRALVLGTSNKTELLLGYGTMFGDVASALNPLGDLYKTQVFALADALALPKSVRSKAPSADLWQGQSDEQELGFSYAMADLVLHHIVDERRTESDLLDLGFDVGLVSDVLARVRESQYKRWPPLIAKLSTRSIGREFRYPRDWGR